MKIRKIEIIPLNIDLDEPFEISLGTMYQAENIVIKIFADEFVGYGESSPFASILCDTQETQWVVAKQFAQIWLHRDISPIADRMNDLDQHIAGNSGIKSAFDMALYDLNARVRGIPLYQFLGATKSKMLTTDMTIGMNTTNHMIASAHRFMDAGFDAIKVKVGKDPQKDIQRIAGIRQAIGSKTHLRIDANQGWFPEQALPTLSALEPYNIEHCEEPVASWNLRAQQHINQNSSIPIMADESLFDHRDAQRLIDFEACSQFNIKLAKSGGLHNALKILGLARKHKIPCQVGCFSETRLGISALAHLSIADDQIVHYDMDSPLMLVDDPIIGGLIYKNGKDIFVDDQPGIGATLDEGYIDRSQVFTVE